MSDGVFESKETDLFPQQTWGWTGVVSVLGALLIAVGLFLLIPLTQLFYEVPEADLIVREMTLVVLPPPEAPPSPPEETPTPQPSPAEITTPSQEATPIEVQPLNVTLSPSSTEAIAMGASVPVLQLQMDAAAAIESLFTFDDLAEAPRLVNMPRFRFPRALLHRGVTEGQVVVEIDILPDGRSRFRRFISSTHRELEPVAREFVEQARFTRPVVNGEPQTVRGRFPLLLRN